MNIIPKSMRPTLDQWKSNHSLDSGLKFRLQGTGEENAALMDEVILADNNPSVDASPVDGMVVYKDDGAAVSYRGDSHNGGLESVLPDGTVIAMSFTEDNIDFLQLSQKSDGIEAIHQHYNRDGSEGWMQIKGAEVVDFDKLQA